jgi:hypothetical protein
MIPGQHSRWYILGILLAISLFATMTSLSLQRMFGAHAALIAIGPVVAALGVLLLAYTTMRRNKD